MRIVKHLFFLFVSFTNFTVITLHAMGERYLPFRMNDPASYVKGVSVIDGGFSAVETDLVIVGPDPLVLKRFYDSNDRLETTNFGGWRILPQCFLVSGQSSEGKQYVFTGDHFGAILSYSGTDEEAFKIDMANDGIGMVNTYATDVSGQTNHQNDRLTRKRDTFELLLGDGTKRIYQKTQERQDELFGGKVPAILSSKVSNPSYFQLVSEQHPSGNIVLFTYDNGRLSLVEAKDSSQKKLHASMRFDYDLKDEQPIVTVTTSDARTITYHFQNIAFEDRSFVLLKKVTGSHCIPISYEYEVVNGIYTLKKKILPEGRFLGIEYDNKRRVKALKEPPTSSDESEIVQRFSYAEGFTEVFNAEDVRVKYLYDDRLQLVGIEQYDRNNELYRSDRTWWGETDQDYGMLKSMAVIDRRGRVHSARIFQYDNRGNIEVESLYGNLTGQDTSLLSVDKKGTLLNINQVEQHSKTAKYSEDGLNLLIELGDCKGIQTLFEYKPGTNRLIKKIIQSTDGILKRTFCSYNKDGVCIKIIEDDGSDEDPERLVNVKERHITTIEPRENIPGVGLPQVVEEKALDLKTKKWQLIRKQIHSYFPQGQLRSTETYDDQKAFAYKTSNTYTTFGFIETETDRKGRETIYKYDGVGNQVLRILPHQKREIAKRYDLRNRCFLVTETVDGVQAIEKYEYDSLGNKISSTNRFGQLTQFDYDEFSRMRKITHPTVLDEHEVPIRPVFSYTHDIFGNVLSITDPKKYVTTKTYNIRGSPTQILYPDGSVELFKYDPEGTLHRSLTRDDQVTVHEYDSLGRISYRETSAVQKGKTLLFLKGHRYEYNGLRIVNEIEQEGLNEEVQKETHYYHDCVGRLISTVQHDGRHSENHSSSRKTEFIYDSLGREIKKKIWFNGEAKDFFFECCEYDVLDRIKEKRVENADGRIRVQRHYAYNDSDDYIEEYTYHNGQRQTISETKYDGFGELIFSSDACKNKTIVDIDCRQGMLCKTVMDPLFNRTEIISDALGRVISSVKKDPNGVLLSSQKMFYDASGNKAVEKNQTLFQGTSLGVQINRWIYGPMDRMEMSIEAEGTNEEKKSQFFYDCFGRLEAKKLPGAQAPLVYSYNEEGRLEKIEYKGKEQEKDISLVYAYDGAGNIRSAKALNGIAIERKYDVFGQIIRETIEDKIGTINDCYSLDCEYDRIGRLVKIYLPDRSSISYEYDGLFGKYVKRLSSQGKLQYQHTYESYDDQGRLFQDSGLAGPRTIHYDACNRKIWQTTEHYSEGVPDQGYDALGNLVHIERKGGFPTQSSLYQYDGLSQLTLEHSSFSKTYVHDSLGNCRFFNGENRISNALNQFTESTNQKYSYSSQGGLSQKTVCARESLFTHDVLLQLITIEEDNQTTVRCTYDPFGRRIAKKIFWNKGGKEKLISSSQAFYFGYHELGIYDENEKMQELRIPGLSGDRISQTSIAFELSGTLYAPIHDISGNVVALINPTNKKVVESYSYTAFGEETVYNASGQRVFHSVLGNPWRYKEKRVDEESGLIYFGLRYYDPSVHQWISPDPLGSLDGPNAYAFLHNNPLTSLDRFGLAAEDVSKDSFKTYFYGDVENHCYCERHRHCKRGGDIQAAVSMGLPAITYDFAFEQIWGFIDPRGTQSQIFDLGRNENENKRIGFINGVWNDLKNAKKTAEYISELAGGYNVHYVHNASHGYVIDLLECAMGLSFIATEPVRQLHRMWDDFFDKSSVDSEFLMIGHSQGMIHIRNALLAYSKDRRNRISVVGIAPGAYVYRETCAQVAHYRTKSRWGDFVPRIDRSGATREYGSVIDLPGNSYIPLKSHFFDNEMYTDILFNSINVYLDE